MSTTGIVRLLAWEALDSRGAPTVGCLVGLESGAEGVATVPAGASTGAYEAREARDGGERYGGRGVTRAVASVKGEIAAAVTGLDARDQEGLDRALVELDGTADLGRLGANAILGVSVAAATAAAAAAGEPLWRHLLAGREPLLPLPMVNVVSGGAHAPGGIDFQDFLVVPVGAASLAEAIEWAARVRAGTRDVLRERGLETSLVADEGGLGPLLSSNREALEVLVAGIERSGLAPGEQAAVAVDVAASQLRRPDGSYALEREGRALSAQELVDELAAWRTIAPLVSVEDVLGEDDWDGWRAAGETLSGLQLVGDDLFATDRARLARGIACGAANAVLVKPNQAGTLSGARATLEAAREAGYATIVSTRSGDTEDSWPADLAVGWRAGQIKVGSTTRGERTAKWNRLLRIEAELGGDAELAGRDALAL